MELIKEKECENFSHYTDTYLSGLKQVLDTIDADQVQIFIAKLLECYHQGGFVYIFGNGGSASTASHFANDFNKVASEHLQKKFRFCCLNDNVPTMLSIANDIGYNQIFKFQLKNYLTSKDLVIGISGSGNSKNVINAIEYANSIEAETIGLVGFDGGLLKKIAKHCIHIPVNSMQHVEDAHLILNHLIMTAVKSYLEETPHDY